MLYHTGEEKPPETYHVPKAALTLHHSLIKPIVQTQIIPATTMPAPLIQKPILRRIRIHPRFPKIFQTTPKPIKSLPTTRMSLPAALMYSQAIKRHSPHIKYKPQHIKAPIQITELHAQMPVIINKSLPLSKAVMILPVRDLKKGLQGNLPHLLKAGPNYLRG